MGREFELKFRATREVQKEIRRAFTGDWQEIQMETTYYDTKTREAGRRHWTLRRRLENGKSVCTVKTPAPDGGRGEWETECPDILEAIPELCKLGGPRALLLFLGQEVIPVCAAKFTRQAATLTLGDCTVEIALDLGVLRGGDKEIPLCEVEVELKSGSQDAAVAFAEALAEKYALVPEPKSKFARAAALSLE